MVFVSKSKQGRKNSIVKLNLIRKAMKSKEQDVSSLPLSKASVPGEPELNVLVSVVDTATQTRKSYAPWNLAGYASDPPEREYSVLGRRALSITSVLRTVEAISWHSSNCNKSPVVFDKEVLRGMCSKIVFKCGCNQKFFISSNSGDTTLKINDSLVWGSQISAIGHDSITSLFASMDLPSLSFVSFKIHQDQLYDVMLAAIQSNMKKWGAIEAQMARNAGEFITIEGKEYPRTTTILDGGWNRRSYGHGFSSNAGIAVIIGSRTGKIIYADTRISTCCVCDKKRPEGIDVPIHVCYKSWNGPATAMESDIILKGFQESISSHGLIYDSFIGDADSSVHSKVLSVYPGMEVRKVECTNHVTRNFTRKLIEISSNQVKGKDSIKISADERRLFNPRLYRRRSGLTQAIKHNSEENNTWEELRDDIVNIPFHVFGDHRKCKAYFCRRKQEVNLVPSLMKMNLWIPLDKAIQRVASLAKSLILKKTSNSAEQFMSVTCKFNEGKRKNLGQRYLYTLRMAGAILSYNETAFWGTEAFKVVNEKDPSKIWQNRSMATIRRRNCKRTYRKSKPLIVRQLATRVGDIDYGSDPITPDMDKDVLELAKSDLRKSLHVTKEQSKEIEESTKDQANSSEWFKQRRGRITASITGSIFTLRATTTNKRILDQYFGRACTRFTAVAMKYGKDNEDKAIAAYEEKMGFSKGYVKRAGLFVYEDDGIIGASPDGLVGDNGLLEVKCPYSLFKKQASPISWHEVSPEVSCLVKKDGELQLKPSHHYYYQVVTQLHVTKKEWCDFVVWSDKDIFVQRIFRSSETEILWDKMLQKLRDFWEEDLAPEIIDLRFDRQAMYRLSGKRKGFQKKA